MQNTLFGLSIGILVSYVLVALAIFLFQVLIQRWIFKINHITESLKSIDSKLNYICDVVENEVKQNNRINTETGLILGKMKSKSSKYWTK